MQHQTISRAVWGFSCMAGCKKRFWWFGQQGMLCCSLTVFHSCLNWERRDRQHQSAAWSESNTCHISDSNPFIICTQLKQHLIQRSLHQKHSTHGVSSCNVTMGKKLDADRSKDLEHGMGTHLDLWCRGVLPCSELACAAQCSWEQRHKDENHMKSGMCPHGWLFTQTESALWRLCPHRFLYLSVMCIFCTQVLPLSDPSYPLTHCPSWPSYSLLVKDDLQASLPDRLTTGGVSPLKLVEEF